jgi:hypothetical protein
MVAQQDRQIPNHPHGTVRVVRHKGREKVPASVRVGQTLVEPGVEDVLEGEVGPGRIHDARPWVDVCFNRERLQQALAEAMDRRARQFAELIAGLLEIPDLVPCRALWEGEPQRNVEVA